jgi:hypothetical protein
MKTKKSYSVEALLRMPPIETRIEGVGEIRRTVTISSTNKRLVYDENGNLVPEWCGTTIPINQLPKDHTARAYLEQQRKFDVDELSDIWDICYCEEALPEDRAVDRYYRRLPYGCKDSPQGRIILPIYDDAGVRHGWQARVIDFENAHGDKFVWTDSQTWLQVKKSGVDPAISDKFPKGFAPSKYLNATGSHRNALLFGVKQAVQFNKDRPFHRRYCVLMEGPLDAMRGGPPCIALLGNVLSNEQAATIRKNFAAIYILMDNDKAGQKCRQCIYRMLEGLPIHELAVPAGKKDLGECSYEEARAILPNPDNV